MNLPNRLWFQFYLHGPVLTSGKVSAQPKAAVKPHLHQTSQNRLEFLKSFFISILLYSFEMHPEAIHLPKPGKGGI
jgi:hypothetical protein